MKLQILTVILSFLGAASVQAQEPAYCDPATFSKYEVKYTGAIKKAPKYLHAYKIGGLTLAGMAVGRSDAAEVAKVALTYGSNLEDSNYCTWYWNDGNDEAEVNFSWTDLPKPSGKKYAEMVETYTNLMGDQFDESEVSFASCAAASGYVGMGCNAQHHRGPSVWSMLLGYAGCSPKNSAAIANKIWGTNGIKTEMREALAKRGAEIAESNPEKSQKLRDLMNSK